LQDLSITGEVCEGQYLKYEEINKHICP